MKSPEATMIRLTLTALILAACGGGTVEIDEINEPDPVPQRDTGEVPDPKPDLSGCPTEREHGTEPGDWAADWQLYGEGGEVVRLWDHCETGAIVVTVATWCGACSSYVDRIEAVDTDDWRSDLQVLYLVSDVNREDSEALTDWGDDHGVTRGILAADDVGVADRYEIDGGIPSATLIGPAMQIRYKDDHNGIIELLEK